MSFERIGKRQMLSDFNKFNEDNERVRHVENLEYSDVIKDIDLVKNALCVIKDNIFYCKHYDTIIFAYDIETKHTMKLYWDCSQTSNRMIWSSVHYLQHKGVLDSDYDLNNHITNHEENSRNNQFSGSIFS